MGFAQEQNEIAQSKLHDIALQMNTAIHFNS